MTPLHAATQDCFGAIRQLRLLDPAHASAPEAMQQQLRRYVDEMQAKLSREGFAHQDTQDITYAIVALADEVALNSAEQLANHWMTSLLQFHYFQENTAGNGFFTRLESIRRDVHRKDALRVYAWCLAFGFQGKYRIRGAEVELLTLTESLQREVGGAGRDVEVLSPDGDRPSESLRGGRKSAPLVYVSVGLLAAALLLFAGLKIALSTSMSSLRQDMTETQRP